MTVLTDKPKVGWTDAALLTKEFTEIYSTPTPKGWSEPKKFTIAGVQYLYPKPKHESYSSTTHYNLWYKRKHS